MGNSLNRLLFLSAHQPEQVQEEVNEVQVEHQGAHDGKLPDGLFVELVFHVGQVFLLTYLGKQRKNSDSSWAPASSLLARSLYLSLFRCPEKSGGLMGQVGFDIISFWRYSVC